MTEAGFHGFPPEGLQFLVDLSQNNDRAWFQPRKAEYERLLKEPMAQLCVALDELFRADRIPLHADPAKSPFRIYRDVRFSTDKRPYKTAVAASFGWAGDRDEVSGRSHAADVHASGAALVAVAIGASVALRRYRIKSFWPYLLIGGVASWFGFFLSGLNPVLEVVAQLGRHYFVCLSPDNLSAIGPDFNGAP